MDASPDQPDPPADLGLCRRLLSDTDSVLAVADDGAALLAYDIAPSNLLVADDGTVYVVDWGFACRGAGWVDQAMFVPRLVGAGHDPASAERLLADAGVEVPGIPAVTGVAALWTMYNEYKIRHGPQHQRSMRAKAATAARAWLHHRTAPQDSR